MRPSTPALVARFAMRSNASMNSGRQSGIAGVIERIHADEDVGASSTSAQASAKERKIVLRAGT